jgi:hypothetical protein
MRMNLPDRKKIDGATTTIPRLAIMQKAATGSNGYRNLQYPSINFFVTEILFY